MGKRKRRYSSSTDEEEIDRKIRRLEKKMKKIKRKRRRNKKRYSSSSSSRSSSPDDLHYDDRNSRISRSRERSADDTRRRSRSRESSSDRDSRGRSPASSQLRKITSKSDLAENLSKQRASRSKERTPSLETGRTSKEVADKELNNKTEDSLNQTSSIKEDEKLDDDILQLIGKRLKPDKVRPPAIHSDIQVRWQEIYKEGLPHAERKELVGKYVHAENSAFLDPPKVNTSLKNNVIPEPAMNRDNRLMAKQGLVSTCLAALGPILSKALNKSEVNNNQLIETLSDTCRLLVDVQREECLTRRKLLSQNIKVSLRDTLKETEVDEWLFSKDLDEKLKAAKLLEKTSQELKLTNKQQGKSNTKNSRGPPKQQKKQNETKSRWSGQQKQQNQSRPASNYDKNRSPRDQYNNRKRN
ncbi:hypothetical protein QAD02_017881 [Eretmocerus hayati]|uniref:Uncharacterized protein n=1 Tax=Eretmocerus hayati TaxID=131215 RepID=A0ACC2PEV3_9HYME|nr:hypothetical protein QAD02_017881 [Eretmocerus hayati]